VHEQLEPRLALAADVIISEFSARNRDVVRDEDGESSDWIELMNVGSEPANLQDWHLTDDANRLDKWSLPPKSLAPGDTLLVFASGKDRDNPLRPLHTNFQLDGDGEFLGLSDQDQQLVDAYAPRYPPQVTDVSYGVPVEVRQETLVHASSTAWRYIPRDGTLDYVPSISDELNDSWLDPSLVPTAPAWQSVTMGVGYRDRATDPNPGPGEGTLLANSVTEFSSFQNRDGWRYGYWDRSADVDGYDFTRDFTSFAWSGSTTISRFNHWDGTKWDLSSNVVPATELTATGGRPADGSDDSPIHDVIRRWTSDVAGTVLVSGEIGGPGGVSGIVARLLVDGNVVLERTASSRTGSYERMISVNAGSRIDFVLSAAATSSVSGESTRFTARIEDITHLIGDSGPAPSLADHLATDLQSEMQGTSSSIYLHIPFVPTDVEFDALTLRIHYDDAFIAYLNGQRIAWAGIADPDQANWDTRAARDRSVPEVLQVSSFDITQAQDRLIADGVNVLQVHGMNVAADDDDFLIAAELVGTTLEIDKTARRYFVTPTPNAPNGRGVDTLGPLLLDHAHSPAVPRTTDPILVTVDVASAFHAIGQVELVYRVMYGDERVIAMNDVGQNGDQMAGDGTYSTRLPAGLATSGQMLRWYFRATDVRQQPSRLPRYVDPLDSEQYFGTIILNTEVNSHLPVLHWFVPSREAAMTDTGARGSLYYDGEFYDNVRFDIHGQSSRGFPTSKKSIDVDFPRDHRFRLADDLPRMKDFNLLTNFADKSKLRNTLAYEQRRLIGDPYHLAFPIRVHHNGQFFAVYDFVEDGDDRWLERLGLDPNGALYKMYNRLDAAVGEKKTRRNEGNSDLQALVAGLQLPRTERDRFLMDNINLPAMANYLAGFVITSNRDCCHKNYYAYRDTDGTGEWQFMPWDVDLSQGRNWGGFGLAYFDDTMYPDNPLYMGSNNELISALYELPGFREMYLRRVRTLIDMYVKPPGTPASELPLERRVDEWVASIAEDARLDNQRHPANWGQTGEQTFEQATRILKDEYAGPRREFLYNTQVAADTTAQRTIISGSPGQASLRYWVPQDNSLGQNWTLPGFDDASWSSGFNGVGFERSPPGYNSLIATNVDAAMADRTSIYLRLPFNLASVDPISRLTLRMKYDDGFIAYLNGTEVARRNVGGGAPRVDMSATNRPDSLAVVFEDIDISAFSPFLRPTGNVLAIQAVNQTATSSDFLALAELIDGIPATGGGEIPLAQVGNPHIDFGQIEFNPASGNQDEEYVELKNPHAFAVDLSGWRIDGGVRHTLAPGTVLPPGWSLFLTPNAKAFRARTTGPSGQQGQFVQGNYAGHLSNFGETLTLISPDGTIVNTTSYEGDPTDAQKYLRISEVMYHPLGPDDIESSFDASWTSEDFEYIELVNTASSSTLDLRGVNFTEGVSFNFSASRFPSLAPGERIVVVRNEAAFRARYGNQAADRVAGEFQFATGLSNDGETIKLEDATGSTVAEFRYEDDGDRGWPERADGQGSSLEWDGVTMPLDSSAAWRASTEVHGSPGTSPRAVPLAVKINELLVNPGAGRTPAVELMNAGATEVDLREMFVVGTSATIADMLTVPAGNGPLGPRNYRTLSALPMNLPMQGSLHLVHRDSQNRLSFVDTIRYSATDIGQTWGRVPDGGPYGFALSQPSLGAPNGSPAIGPLMLSEIHYHPSDPPEPILEIAPGLTEDDLEFIEISNLSTAPVRLAGWRLRGDVDLDFDSAQVIPPSSSLVVVSFHPDRPENAGRVAAFRQAFGLSAEVTLTGGYSGQLSNQAERVSLQAPIGGVTSLNHRVVDEVRYADAAPWPDAADGNGGSLQRVNVLRAGDDPGSWQAVLPTPGQFTLAMNFQGDFNSDGRVDSDDIDAFCAAFRTSATEPRWDLNGDGQFDVADRDWLVHQILRTAYGDANLDGRFNSSDLVQVFVQGQYEDGIAGNSTWNAGDWNCDGDFSTTDLVLAFSNGGYQASAASVTSLDWPLDAPPLRLVDARVAAVVMPAPQPTSGRGWQAQNPASDDPCCPTAGNQQTTRPETLRADPKSWQPAMLDHVFALDTDWDSMTVVAPWVHESAGVVADPPGSLIIAVDRI
jgi:hypothetical protein